jgi:hypothetical protein
MEYLKIIFTSTLIAGIVSAFVSYFISIRLKKIDFKNEYYKEILKKRLVSYQYIESQLAVLKTVVLDEKDNKPYHTMFSYGSENFFEFQKNLFLAMSYSLWIDDETTNKLEDLNELFYNLNIKTNDKTNKEIIEIGKKYYDQISKLRIQLENATKKGLYNLHDINKAFKIKKTNGERYIRELK